MRVGITYAVVAWLIIQVAGLTFEGFGIPIWAFRFVVLCVLLGFPIAIILAWTFELTPDGIKTTKSAQEDAEATEAHSKKRNWLAYGVGAILPTVIFGALALFFNIRFGDVTQGSVGDKSIAVLPLENMSPDPENAFFADGVQEDILTNLSKIDDLGLVISRSSTLRYRNPDRNLKQVGEELGVRYIVEGSVRRAGDQVRVTVQLIDAQTDDHLWAENYNRDLDDIFAIQAAVAEEIAKQLKAIISPDEIAQIEYRPTENQVAYDYFLRYRQMTETVRGRFDEKAAVLEKAVELDPEFAEAWAFLVRETLAHWARSNRNNTQLYNRAEYALNRAKQHGEGLPHVLLAEASFHRSVSRNVEAANKLYLEIWANDPGFPEIHRIISMVYNSQGRLEEAKRFLETEIRMNPLSPKPKADLFRVYKHGGLWDEALDLIRGELLQEDPDIWQKEIANINYLKSGDKEAFQASLKNIPGFINTPTGKIWDALVSKDYQAAVRLLENLESADTVEIFSPGLSFRPPGLLNGLIWFELKQESNRRASGKSARDHLENLIYELGLDSPINFAWLAICHALEGNREKFNSAVLKIREQSSQPFSEYFSRLRCELHIAIAYIVLGDHDKAIETLEAASKMDSPIFLNRELDLWFIFDRLRGNPRFDALLKD